MIHIIKLVIKRLDYRMISLGCQYGVDDVLFVELILTTQVFHERGHHILYR